MEIVIRWNGTVLIPFHNNPVQRAKPVSCQHLLQVGMNRCKASGHQHEMPAVHQVLLQYFLLFPGQV